MTCAACHGLKGLPDDKSIPIIWGQQAGYLYLDFRDFQKGARKDDRMTPIAQSIAKEDALALVEYFAAKPSPTGAPAASKADAVATVTNKSVVCTSCHLEEFQGGFLRAPPRRSAARLPPEDDDRLPQPERANNPGMSDLMNSCTPDQLTAMAAYLAGE